MDQVKPSPSQLGSVILPFGKQEKNYGKSPFFSWENQPNGHLQ